MTSKKGWLVWERKINVTVMQITDKMSAGICFLAAVHWTEEDYLALEVPDAEALVKQAAQWLILDSITL